MFLPNVKSVLGVVWAGVRPKSVLFATVSAVFGSQLSCVRELPGEDTSSTGASSGEASNETGLTLPEGTSPGDEVGGDGAPDGGIPGGEGVPGKPKGPGEQQDSTSGTPGVGETSEPGEAEPEEVAECVEGRVRSCEETPEGNEVIFPTGTPVGSCRLGEQACQGGRWTQCLGLVGPQASDRCDLAGDDSDCNGVANDGCDCVDGETRPCGETSLGECRKGVQACVGGKWSDECDGAVLPAKERCDGAGKDEDCDGRIDLDDEQCECLVGAFEYCARAGQKGDCRIGRRSCQAGRWGACEEWAKPELEKCGTRAPVEKVKWTGDEDCDGDVDVSPLGRRGPAGCVRMMLDRDGDGYGAIGVDLSDIKSKSQLSEVATACLCKERPDFSQKEREGWVEVNGKEARDCGDCAPGMGGESVYPGSPSSAVESNRCLENVGWVIGSKSKPMKGDFDLNCDGRHSDPTDKEKIVGVIKCVTHDDGSCGYESKGRLIPQGSREIWCGGTFEIGECVPPVLIPEFPDPIFGTLGSVSLNRQTPEKCEIKGTGKKHTIRCQ